MPRDSFQEEKAAFDRYLRRPGRRRLARVVRLLHGHVWSVSLRLTGNDEDAADVCQDVFLSLILHPPEPGSVRSPRGYLSFRVLTLTERLRRSARRRREREIQAARNLLPEEKASREDMEEVLDALERLSPRVRRAMELRYLAGLSVSEIGDILSISERSAAGDLKRGRELLRGLPRGSPLGVLLVFAHVEGQHPAEAVMHLS